VASIENILAAMLRNPKGVRLKAIERLARPGEGAEGKDNVTK
jgi:hypothetical protein